MDTNELIKALAADTRPPAASLSSVWWGAAGLAIALAAAVFFATLGPRPDIAAAAETPRFLFKFVVTITLAVSAFGLARALSRPGETWRKAMPYLAAAPALIAMAVIVELVRSAAGHVVGQVGRHQQHCLPDLHSADRHWPARHLPAGATPRRADETSLRRGGRGTACRRHRGHLLRRPVHGRFPAFRRHLVHDRHRRACPRWSRHRQPVCPLVGACEPQQTGQDGLSRPSRCPSLSKCHRDRAANAHSVLGAGGADGIRTHDLDGANVALSQLSYGPGTIMTPRRVPAGLLGLVEPMGIEPTTSRVRF